MGIEYGEQKVVMINIFCEAHGDLGNVPQSDVSDIVEGHREQLGCYYPIKLGISKILIQKAPEVDS